MTKIGCGCRLDLEGFCDGATRPERPGSQPGSRPLNPLNPLATLANLGALGKGGRRNKRSVSGYMIRPSSQSVAYGDVSPGHGDEEDVVSSGYVDVSPVGRVVSSDNGNVSPTVNVVSSGYGGQDGYSDVSTDYGHVSQDRGGNDAETILSRQAMAETPRQINIKESEVNFNTFPSGNVKFQSFIQNCQINFTFCKPLFA